MRVNNPLTFRALITLLCSAVLCFAFLALGFCEERVLRISVHRANIRNKPKSSSGRIGSAEKGKRFIALKEKNGWYHIRIEEGRKDAWVYKSVVELLPQGEGLTPEFTAVAESRTPVFEKSDFFSKRRGHVNAGEKFKRSVAINGWARISQSSGLQGWMPLQETIMRQKERQESLDSTKNEIFLELLTLINSYNKKKLSLENFIHAKWYPEFSVFQNKENISVSYINAFDISVELNLYVQKVSIENFFPIEEESFLYLQNADKFFLCTVLEKMLSRTYCSKASVNIYLLKTDAGKGKKVGWVRSGKVTMDKKKFLELKKANESLSNYWGHLDNTIPEESWK